jgi:ribose/xylose/arabinose/galactoside ABC-type transport system permease subunit
VSLLRRWPALGLLAAMAALFSVLSPVFLQPNNLVNILVQSASLGVVATGMAFVLLTAGIDLSVGSAMFVSAALAGKLVVAGWGLGAAFVVVVGVGLAWGLANGLVATRLGVKPFVVTLATLYVGRGFGLWLTQTRALNLPDSLLLVGSARVLGIPLPVAVLGVVLVGGHVVLERTPFGRHLYAVGADAEVARRAGVPVRRTLLGAYAVAGLLAALGGAVAVAQLGAVSPTFGRDREFAAIAAAVLGGVSLFGGKGRVLPGVLLGTLLLQTVENGLVIVNADPYLYPMVLASVIFVAVLLDSLQARQRRGAPPRA